MRCSRFLICLSIQRRNQMAEPKFATNENEISRDRLAELLNEDLSREYQAIIAQNLCRELKYVRIRRLFPGGTAANWEPAGQDALGTCRMCRQGHGFVSPQMGRGTVQDRASDNRGVFVST